MLKCNRLKVEIRIEREVVIGAKLKSNRLKVKIQGVSEKSVLL